MFENESAVMPREPRPGIRPHRPDIRRAHHVLYTDAEWAHLQEIARLCGKQRSDFIRDVSLRRRVRVKPYLADAPLIRALSDSGMALTRLAATARASGALPAAAELDAALAELRQLLRRVASAETRSGTR